MSFILLLKSRFLNNKEMKIYPNPLIELPNVSVPDGPRARIVKRHDRLTRRKKYVTCFCLILLALSYLLLIVSLVVRYSTTFEIIHAQSKAYDLEIEKFVR